VDPEARIRTLQQRLDDAEDTIEAIRAGSVDAFVIDRGAGARVYTLEAADRPYRLLVESMQQGAAMLLPDGTVLFANPRLAQMLGMDPRALRGQSILRWFDEHMRPEVDFALREGRREPVNAEFVLEATGGRRLAVQWSSAPMPVENTVTIGVIITDLTERLQHEAVLRTSERLQALDRRKDEFLATLAHELRNPLAPITNALEILRGAPEGAPASSMAVNVIDRQVRLLARLVDDLLDLGRITTGQVMLHRHPVCIEDVLKQAIETSQPLLRRGGHQLRVSWPDEPVWIDGDESRLAQVFANLLNNAAVYSPTPGELWLKVQRTGHDVRVSVVDHGIGIAPHMLSRVFEIFTQANPGQGSAGAGLGIGLSLVKSLVELHGGTVRATSRGLGHGAEFEVRLPVVARPATAAPCSAPELPALDRARAQVLVVDDNEDAAVSLGTVLEAMGLDATVVHDGASALAHVATHPPDVILLDLGMPGLDGYETCRRLRNQLNGSSVRIVALTGWGMDQDRERTTRAGFDLHLVKPVHPAVIVEQIRRWQQVVPV
jgi:PAS domain S-box-containing protein